MAYEMPKVRIGQPVYHFQGQTAHGTPAMAFVTEKGGRTVTLAVLPPQQKDFIIRDGVRHASDPDLPRFNESGCWDFPPEDDPKPIFKKKPTES